jgi:hypothetical protein
MFVYASLGEQGPYDARRLVRERDSDKLVRLAHHQAGKPFGQFYAPLGLFDDGLLICTEN